MAILLFPLPPVLRREILASACVLAAYCAALPLAASLLQYSVVGLNRFVTGYGKLRPYYPRVAVIVPAWNEGDVIGTTIERLVSMDYPPDRLRVYVVDDASTDRTPDVVREWQARMPDRVRHLRREKGGEGKAHTLNHGIAQVLAEPWAEALLIIDADVLFADSALRRMARHLSDPTVGAVTAYIKEGTAGGNYLTRFIAYEYITAQAASRRAQNVFGVLACLAGGAQLHSRRSLEAIGGRIDTSSLAEDTVTTFRTQLSGNRVVFEGNAIVWAEEPGDLVGLWKQRLRWSRGNVQSRCSSRRCGCADAATAGSAGGCSPSSGSRCC
jgi:cellulose synthase/poly-beta-1,6-N-acetylglucosamine synthase-like glycosyltransferase